ncbi:hypothetical protein KCU87_g504, partial [Aureobasidium melanogenum]
MLRQLLLLKHFLSYGHYIMPFALRLTSSETCSQATISVDAHATTHQAAALSLSARSGRYRVTLPDRNSEHDSCQRSRVMISVIQGHTLGDLKNQGHGRNTSYRKAEYEVLGSERR